MLQDVLELGQGSSGGGKSGGMRAPVASTARILADVQHQTRPGKGQATPRSPCSSGWRCPG